MRNSRPKSRAGLTLMRLLVVIAIIGVSVGFLSPTIWRHAARRLPWLNNLKQQALAVTSYLSAFGNLSSNMQPHTGTQLPWQRQTSPYLQHQGLYDQYGQPPTGTSLPWQTQSSPYVNHQGL